LKIKGFFYKIHYFFKSNYENFNSDVIHQIGNLLIIPYHTNSGLPDKMEEKIEKIKSDKKYIGNLRYVDDFLKKYDDCFLTWGKQSIEKRSLDLAKEAYDSIWFF